MIERNVKTEIARRQLGTALSLFLADDDPVSVHCLACGGGEIADFLARDVGKKPFSQHALEVHPDMKVEELVKLRNKYWNAMKHARRQNDIVRDDDEILESFDDKHNDHALFISWYDYATATGFLPIEAQAFQVWYFANYPEMLTKDFPAAEIKSMFPRISIMTRSDKKRSLSKGIAWANRQRGIFENPRTDRRKLVLGRMSAQLKAS